MLNLDGLLLFRDSDGASATASGLGVLASDADAPVVAQTAMGTDLLETLEVLTQLAVEGVCNDLRVLAVLDVLLSVEEPVGDLVLARVLHDGHDALQLVVGQLACALVEVDVCLL